MILTKLAEPTKPAAVRLPARFTDGLVAGVCDRAGLHAGRMLIIDLIVNGVRFRAPRRPKSALGETWIFKSWSNGGDRSL